ncbi:Phenylacetate-coenzyme A ligase [Photorhabdus australis subsp. thailandensis]|uniref:long-chain-fatty-acyl-CoA reductase n=1 Tax=Photorhabdus australis subsp. thailandensis TaxID=2805096 RepID=A0A1C0U9E2_9GAMM|nr:acyl-CoA reductase [Photorhabdus australis]OCQ54548.1 Phenylacetate-coenzyme A ligase [Photorhabdus australis subsp. thailandensis]
MYLINGEVITDLEPAAVLAELKSKLADTLACPPSVQQVLECAGRFADNLDTVAAKLGLDTATINTLRSFCHRDSLEAKLRHELGEQPFSLRRFDYTQPRFETWQPLGLVVHITPANAPLLPFMAVLESLLVGNVNWLRPSSSDRGLNAQILAEFLRHDPGGKLASYVSVLPLPSDQLSELLDCADAVSAWGSNTALTAIRSQLRPGCRWIDWGHRISFAYLDPIAASSADYDALADDICRFDQQACSSPQCLLIDSIDEDVLRQVASAMAAALARRAPVWPALQPDIQEAAEISSQMAFLQLDQTFAGLTGSVEQGNGWRIAWIQRQELVPSPLYRTLQIRPAPRAKLVEILLPWRPYLQSCGLIAKTDELTVLSRQLLTAGVSRICQVGAMHDGYEGEPHDGVYALTRLARRVSVSLKAEQLPGHVSLDKLSVNPPELAGIPVMDKAKFQQNGVTEKAQLFFRSGGSSGAPKLAGFSRRDYHSQMQAAADGLFSAGLDPAQDRVMNLLYGGNLYGGMLSFFTILDKLSVPHYPMGGPIDDDFSQIRHFIVTQGVNTLVGMPSTIHRLFECEEAALRAYGGVRKVFTGGEHISEDRRQFLSSFGVQVIRSAIYGSVDAGPLGHACACCHDGEFHLLSDIQWLEILALDSDQPVPNGETGRLVFTPLAREGQWIQRYDLGDLGHWLPGSCSCGLPAPRFKLEGRHGALIRVGSIFLNPTELSAGLAFPVQWLVGNNSDGCDYIHILADGDADLVRIHLLQHSRMLNQVVSGGLLQLEVIPTPVGQFRHHPQSGKTPLVLDYRL